MVLDCTICGKSAQKSVVNPEESESQNFKISDGVIKSLLKLLKVVDSDQIYFQEKFDSHVNWNGLFCSFCNSRNEEIYNLYTQLDYLNDSIEKIKESIEKDFTTSCNEKGDQQDGDKTLEPECNVEGENTVRLVSKNLRRLIDQSLKATKWKISSTQTNEDDVQQPKSTRLRSRLKAKIVEPHISDEEEKSCSSFHSVDEDDETDSDFNVEKSVIKRRKLTRVKKVKKIKLKTFSTSSPKVKRKIPVKLQKQIKRQYKDLKDVVVQVEKLPTDYLSKLSQQKNSENNHLSTSEVTSDKGSPQKMEKLSPLPEDSNGHLYCRLETCRKSFKTEEERNYHIKKKHEGCTHPFSCGECGRKFRQQKIYEIHVKSHQGVFPFLCKICQKGFCNKGALKSHAVRHTTETPFKCELCPKEYKGYGGLVYHKRKVHSGEHPYICEICGSGFVKSDKLQRHRSSVHAKDKDKICHICGKSFSIQNYLYMHMRIHQGIPYKSRKKSVIETSGSSQIQLDEQDSVEVEEQEQIPDTLTPLEPIMNAQPNLVVSSQEEEEDHHHYPQISTISHGSQQRQIILTLDTKSSTMSHRLQTENPTSNGTFVINFNKKALASSSNSNKFGSFASSSSSRTNFGNDSRLSVTYSSNDSVGQVVHEPQNLLLSTGGREGNVIITNNMHHRVDEDSPVTPTSTIHRVETFHFPPLATISNQMIQASQQGVIQYLLPEQFPNGFEFFSNQNPHS